MPIFSATLWWPIYAAEYKNTPLFDATLWQSNYAAKYKNRKKSILFDVNLWWLSKKKKEFNSI